MTLSAVKLDEKGTFQKLEITTLTREGELADQLKTYVQMHNEMVETYRFLAEHGVTGGSGQEWQNRIRALATVSLALDAGFDPFTPPEFWTHGTLDRYMGPIPQQVLERVEVALPIFGPDHLIVHDPRPERFRQILDPIITGKVRLENRDHHFLIGQWDLDQDLKFMDTEPGGATNLMDQAAEALQQAVAHFRKP